MKKFLIILASLLVASALLVSCANNDASVTPDNQVETETPEVETPEVETPEVEAPEVEAPEVEAPEAAVSGLQAIVDGIYEKHPVPFMAGTVPTEMVSADSFAYYTGLADNSKVDEVLVSESMMGSQAYSLVLATVKDGEDVKAVADEMMNGIDQRKWICVEADLIRTVASGNTVMLIMINSEMGIEIDGFVTAFEEIVGTIEYEAAKN